MGLTPNFITSYNSGLTKNKKPFLLIDTAFQRLENAYVWRDRLKKREGLKLVGRLRRVLTTVSLGLTSPGVLVYNFTDIFASGDVMGVSGLITNITNALNAAVTTLTNHNLISGQQVTITGVLGMTEVNGQTFTITVTGLNTFTLGIDSTGFGVYIPTSGIWTTEPHKEIEPGSLFITISAPDAATFDDNGDGTFTVTGVGVAAGSYVNYVTGEVNLVISAAVGGATITAAFNYFPGLPVMGIWLYELPAINDEQSIFFDTKYAYSFALSLFQELVPGTTWTGSDSDFFWATNYRGITPNIRLLFVTNFYINDPIRYFDGNVWTDFAPYVSRATPPNPAVDVKLFQARILIPYYGRLLALNTWEGTETGGPASAVNFFSRCRFSQIGDPTDQILSWRSDLFGRGGFIDAPTSEQIISAIFYKNTLIVFFEKTTWQLRYVGDYGLPFLWERISSDFGSESTFSPILFDEGVLAVGDRAIISSQSVNVQRIDLDIPDFVFSIRNEDDGPKRVHGIRDYQKELAYWCYPQAQFDMKFPNFSLVYNYRNNTFAIFRNNVTAFGNLYSPEGVTWDSQDTTWDDPLEWDNFEQKETLEIVSGNQQGFVHFYGEPDPNNVNNSDINAFDQESLSITAIDLTVSPIQITVIDNNINSDGEDSGEDDLDGEIVYLVGLQFIEPSDSSIVPTDLNDNIYLAHRLDDSTDVLTLLKWDFNQQIYVTDFTFTPVPGTEMYVGGGKLAIFPRLDALTKDFNPYTQQGMQAKMPYLDVLTDATDNASLTIRLFANNSPNAQSNIIIGNQVSETSLTTFGAVVNATQANPAEITTRFPHGLANNDEVSFADVVGMTELNADVYTITVVDSNKFTLDVDSTGFTAYISGGTWSQRSHPFYVKGSDYTWHRFYGGVAGNFFSINLTYDENLMNTFNTHQDDFVLNAMQLWTRPGGKGVF